MAVAYTLVFLHEEGGGFGDSAEINVYRYPHNDCVHFERYIFIQGICSGGNMPFRSKHGGGGGGGGGGRLNSV